MKSSSQKKWFRFTIGKLLLLIAASAIILAAYSQATYSYRQSRASANVIQAAGGSVLWSQSSFFRDATFPSIVQVDLQNCRLQDKEYAALAFEQAQLALLNGEG